MAFVRAGLLTFVSFQATTEPLNHQQCFLLRAKCSKLASEEREGPDAVLQTDQCELGGAGA